MQRNIWNPKKIKARRLCRFKKEKFATEDTEDTENTENNIKARRLRRLRRFYYHSISSRENQLR